MGSMGYADERGLSGVIGKVRYSPLMSHTGDGSGWRKDAVENPAQVVATIAVASLLFGQTIALRVGYGFVAR